MIYLFCKPWEQICSEPRYTYYPKPAYKFFPYKTGRREHSFLTFQKRRALRKNRLSITEHHLEKKPIGCCHRRRYVT
ncbi:hypothetical protein GMOD_00006165 [Pyrenophora seminiperda CCB06]|uniref:Uncharacterized protein n=1 Tax=Pyrenophora seminiperda CCB06 TaxID=1302712 RepID=A0A3M7M4C4_9PLEO|nr:hypothetical protein GMOD_00006165 [Pyrenophora seminiperda CCB06]